MKSAPLLILIMLLAVPIIGYAGVSVGAGPETYQLTSIPALSGVTPARGPMNGSQNGLYGGLVRYDDVALLVNDNSPISKEIGTYFALRRGLPVENIINISVPTAETINPGEFDELARQVQENLSRRGLTDRIDYLVTTKGVPLRVSGNNYRMSSVDSELMLLDGSLQGSIHGNGWIDNPYFESWTPFSRERYGIRLVTRLDGYTKEEAMRLVDLAEPSLGVRGKALLDTDPTKGYSSGGYGIGNYWMVNAHDWLVENGHESLLDMNNTFRTDWTNTSAYFSWGSNDGNWNIGLINNGGFEYGTGPDASSWDQVATGGISERSQEKVGNDAWSLKLSRTGSGKVLAYQNYTLDYLDHRYIIDARVSIASVTSPGARVYAEAFNSRGRSVYRVELYNRTGTRDWESVQKVFENRTNIVTLSIVLEILGSGTAYFDSVGLRVIRPHNNWVPGAIAETCVSTGGRSMAYGTWYGQSLVADLIRDGVTGVKGYVYEPFLSSISHADILFPAYYSSYNLAEAYWMGSEYGSWMDTVLGDPKCAPYLNERADMGFPQGEEPVVTYVENGVPFISFAVFNKGKGNIPGGGKVELYMDGNRIETYDISLASGELLHLNLSSKENPRILGPHEFKVVLNPDGSIWEMDPYNNEVVRNISVNRLPTLSLGVSTDIIRRTEAVNISVLIGDEDGDIDVQRLDISIKDPYGTDLIPDLMAVDDLGTIVVANYTYIAAWNSTPGFHSISARYLDRYGSFDQDLLYGAFRVTNYLPTLDCSFGSPEVMRGWNATLYIDWSDPDTPDGNLTVQGWTVGSLGELTHPSEVVRLSERSSMMVFQLPAYERSRTWEFTVKAIDRDGAEASWTGSVRTLNGLPSLEVEGLAKEMTRLSTATLTITYLDPEGIPPTKLEAKLLGPEGEGPLETVMLKDLSAKSGEAVELLIGGSDLLVGNYTLEVRYEDDDQSGSLFKYPEAVRIINIAPSIGATKVIYMEGEGEPGGRVMRGGSFSIKVPVSDLDGDIWTLQHSAWLLGPEGFAQKEISFEVRPDQTLHARISVGTDWAIGSYGLVLNLMDLDGGHDNITITALVTVDAPRPMLLSAKAYLDMNMTCTLEVVISPVTGSSIPVRAGCILFDANWTEVGSMDLSKGEAGMTWSGTLNLSAVPEFISVLVKDDLGRDLLLNGTLEVEVEEAPLPDDDDDGPGGDDGSLIYLLITAMLVLLILSVVLVLIVAIKRLREPSLKAPPPMAHVSGGVQEHLPAGQPSLLGGANIQGLPPAPLPPGKELNDGSLYHKPGSKEAERPRQKPGRPEDVEEVHELGPRRATVTTVQPVTDVPLAPVPAGPEEPPEPVPFDLSQPIYKGDEVVPQVEDVPDTNHNDIPRDPGQSVQEGGQGPGGGP